MPRAMVTWGMFVVAALSASPGTFAHDPWASRDTHGFWAATGDLLMGCKADSDPPQPWEPYGDPGGTCFDFGTDLRWNAGFRMSVADQHGQAVGGIFRIVDSAGVVLMAYTPYCGTYPVDEGFAALPVGAFRIWIWTRVALSPVLCLEYGLVGVPATWGTITVETAAEPGP